MLASTLSRDLRKLLTAPIESLCPFYRVVLATTMWADPESGEPGRQEYEEQAEREHKLIGNLALLEQQGLMVQRYSDNYDSAKNTLLSVLTAEMPDTRPLSVRGRLTIAVIGVSGAGKTRLISTLTGAHDTTLVEESELAAGSITAYEIQVNGENVILLDTPGLDYRNDREAVFRLLSSWLKTQAEKTCQPRVYLDGIILVHPVFQDSHDRSRNLIRQSFLIDQAHAFRRFEKDTR
ncbi:hypothetical protein AN958_03420 [Leucoagaricus sp. SymC.cos]|nr:hypothetical protein AN958_03420 [Leucoagaricus sp. SymC.cos]